MCGPVRHEVLTRPQRRRARLQRQAIRYAQVKSSTLWAALECHDLGLADGRGLRPDALPFPAPVTGLALPPVLQGDSCTRRASLREACTATFPVPPATPCVQEVMIRPAESSEALQSKDQAVVGNGATEANGENEIALTPSQFHEILEKAAEKSASKTSEALEVIIIQLQSEKLQLQKERDELYEKLCHERHEHPLNARGPGDEKSARDALEALVKKHQNSSEHWRKRFEAAQRRDEKREQYVFKLELELSKYIDMDGEDSEEEELESADEDDDDEEELKEDHGAREEVNEDDRSEGGCED